MVEHPMMNQYRYFILRDEKARRMYKYITNKQEYTYQHSSGGINFYLQKYFQIHQWNGEKPFFDQNTVVQLAFNIGAFLHLCINKLYLVVFKDTFNISFPLEITDQELEEHNFYKVDEEDQKKIYNTTFWSDFRFNNIVVYTCPNWVYYYCHRLNLRVNWGTDRKEYFNTPILPPQLPYEKGTEEDMLAREYVKNLEVIRYNYNPLLKY